MKFGAINGEKEAPHTKVVTLAFLSRNLPTAPISEELARSLCAETGGSVVLVRLQPPAPTLEPNGRAASAPALSSGRTGAEPSSAFSSSAAPKARLETSVGGYDGMATAVDWAPAEVILQGQFWMPSSLARTEAGFHLLTLGARSEPLPSGQIAALVSQLSRQFRHVLIEAPADEVPETSLLEFLAHSDLAYLFLSANIEDVYQLDLLRRKVRHRSPTWGGAFKPVLCLAEGEQIDGFDLLAQRVAAPVHMFVHGCPARGAPEVGPHSGLNRFFRADLRRLAREVAGKLVGLALSSGAAKGFAHIGVIQVLEENGIEVDVVAGASIGAYIGSLWAYGLDGQHLEKLARELEGRWRLWSLIDPVFPPRQGFLKR